MTSTTATLKAKINPGGEGTTYYFEYVTAADYEETGYAGASKAPSTITGAATAPMTSTSPRSSKG